MLRHDHNITCCSGVNLPGYPATSVFLFNRKHTCLKHVRISIAARWHFVRYQAPASNTCFQQLRALDDHPSHGDKFL